jgi:hypothetical protein
VCGIACAAKHAPASALTPVAAPSAPLRAAQAFGGDLLSRAAAAAQPGANICLSPLSVASSLVRVAVCPSWGRETLVSCPALALLLCWPRCAVRWR